MQGNWFVTQLKSYTLGNVFCAILGNSVTWNPIQNSKKRVKNSS